MPEILDVVDANDQVIGTATRDEAYEKCLPIRIVHVLIFDDQGRMALQLRSQHVSFSPGFWSTTVGGHVHAGETYEQAALREYTEELGTTSEMEFFAKDKFTAQDKPDKFLTIFKAIFNGPFRPNPKEVDEVRYFKLPEIKGMIAHGEKFHPELLFILEKYF